MSLGNNFGDNIFGILFIAASGSESEEEGSLSGDSEFEKELEMARFAENLENPSVRAEYMRRLGIVHGKDLTDENFITGQNITISPPSSLNNSHMWSDGGLGLTPDALLGSHGGINAPPLKIGEDRNFERNRNNNADVV